MDGREEIDQLIRLIQAEESIESSFDRLFKHYARPVLQFFVNRGFSVQESEDLGQEVFFKAFHRIGSFRFESHFEHWLFQIVRNVWKNAIRSRKTDKRKMEVQLDGRDSTPIEGEASDNSFEPEDGTQSPLDRMLSEEKRERFLTACQNLPPQMARCVLLRVAQDRKYREIAKILGVSISTVKSQLHAAKSHLRATLDESEYPFEL